MRLVIQKNGNYLHKYMRAHHEKKLLTIIELSVAQFEQGRLLIITNKSGHYKPGTVVALLEMTFCSLMCLYCTNDLYPGPKQSLAMLQWLVKKGIDLSKIEFRIVRPDGIYKVFRMG